ncbi:MAG: DUF4175 family protein [Mucilaginibacter sp.]
MQKPENYTLLIGKIDTFIRKYYLNKLLRGGMFLGAGLFSAYVIITLSEYFGNFDTVFRSILFYSFIALNLALIGVYVLPPLLAWLKLGKSLTHDQAAEIIGEHFSDVKDKLLNTLQLKKLGEEDAQHRELIEASIDQKIETLRPVRFPTAINIKDNTRYIKWILLPLGVIVIIGFAAPSVLTESTKRLIRHNEYFAPVAPFKFVVENKALSVVQGEDLNLAVKLTGNNLPADIYVETANNTFKLDKENITKFHFLFTNIQQNTTFRLSGNGFSSEPYEIRVNLRPSLLHFDVSLNYPAYLHKKNETLPNAGDLTIPIGTTVSWHFHTQNADKLLFFMNEAPLAISPTAHDLFEHSEKIYKNAIYKVAPLNNVVNRVDSALYRINVIADEAPSISVLEKPDSISLRAIYFNGKIQDDHGFSDLTFHYTIGNTGDKANTHEITKQVKADLSQTQSDFFYLWNLKELGINPGDRVTYFFEVADNDGVNGPKKTRSPEHTLNVPSEKELNALLNTGAEVIKQQMQSASKLAGQIERESQKLNQLLLNKNSLSFDEKKQIDDLLQKRRELDELVKQIQDENRKNAYNRQETHQENKDLAEKQQQMDQLLNNALDPKTRDMLQKLQQLLQQDQKEGTRNELTKMQNDSKSSKRELDRMLELYKKLVFEQKLNQNISQLNQLADKQQKLAEQTDPKNQDKNNQQPPQDKNNQQAQDKNNQQSADKNNQQAQDKNDKQTADQQTLQQQQDKLNQEFQDVKKALEDLQKSNEQEQHKQDFENPKSDEQNIEQQMNQSSEQLSKNNRQSASKSQQQSAKQMRQMAQKMQQKEQEEEDSQNAINEQQLRELLKSLVNSSFDQEKVMLNLKSISFADPNYVTLAQQQKNIKDNLKTAEDTLYAISKRITQIQSTVNREVESINTHIDQALDNLGDRRTAEANRNQQYAMTSMNNLALMLSDALKQLQASKSSKSGKGKSKQMSMQQLSQMQQQLNQNMQRAKEQMQQQGGNPSQSQRNSMSEQLAKLAREQQQIRQTFEQLNQENTQNGGAALPNADKTSQQMEQTEKDLVNRRITDEALKRQQQIQTRLLEAEKAEQEREQDQQRQSKAGKDMPPGYIKALQEYQQIKAKQTEQVKTVPPSLNLYYKQKIKSYFDQLNAK